MPRTASSDSTEIFERLDMMLATERDDISDSTLANEPALPNDRTEPLDPMDKIEPTLPIDRIDPAEPIERNESLEAIDQRPCPTSSP